MVGSILLKGLKPDAQKRQKMKAYSLVDRSRTGREIKSGSTREIGLSHPRLDAIINIGIIVFQ